LITDYSWGYDFSEVLSIEDDEAREIVRDFHSLIAGDWITPPKEVVLFDTWFGDGVTTNFAQTISLPAGISIKPFSLSVSATSKDTGGALVTDNAPIIGVDDGVGIISGRNIVSGSIDYTTGVIAVVFDYPPATYAEVIVMYTLDQRSYAYQPGIPHHIYKKDEASLMYRDRELSTNVQLTDAAPASDYSTILLRDANFSSVKVVVTNNASGEVVLYASEKDGYIKNIYNQRVAEYQVEENLGLTAAMVIYSFNIPAGPPRILPIVPGTPLIIIDEMEIKCDFDGNLTGSGDIDGVTFNVVSGTINYATGAVDFTIVKSVGPPANPTINIPIVIHYKKYEFALKGTGAALVSGVTLANTPITPGSVKFMQGGVQLISDNGLGKFITDTGEDWGTVNYATGLIALAAVDGGGVPIPSINNDFYGFTYQFTPLEVEEADSKYYRSAKQVIGKGGGAMTLFCAPEHPTNPCITGHLLQPIPMVPASFYFRCGTQWGRADETGAITGSAGISGDIDFNTGAYSILFTVPPADYEEIHAGWDCNFIKVKFNQTIDSVADFDIQVNSKSVNADNNYDQANSFHYTRNSLSSLNTELDFLYRGGYAEGIGVGDGTTTDFAPPPFVQLTKYLAATPPGTQIQPNSVTIIAWCFNPNRLKLPYTIGNPVQVLAYDDGSGNIVGADDDLAPVLGTINYVTGRILTLDFGLTSPPASGTNIVVHYTDIERSSSALKEIGWYHWKDKGSRLSILKAGALYYNA